MESSATPVRFRQYPGLTREDAAQLTALAQHAGVHVARAFERLIRSQNAATKAFHETVKLECELWAPTEILGAETLARWSHGPGGGRHCHPAGQPPDA